MSMEAERGLIGAILIDQNCLYDIYNILRPDMLQNPFNQDCYREMLAMYDKAEQINLMTLSQKLESRDYDTATIGQILRECLEFSPTSVMAKSYADTIIKDYKAKTLHDLITRISLKPKDIDNSIAEIMARCEELQNNQSQKSKSMKQIVEENKGQHFNDNVGEGLIRTGLYKLDECLGGLEPGDVIVIGARPGVGKSALSTQIIEYVARKKYKVGYFNLEMSEKQVYQRMVSKKSKLSLTRVRRAKAFLGDEEEKFNAANEELSKLNIVISTNSRKISEIKAESRHQGYDLIIIDYLQLIQAERKYANRSAEVGDISKAVKSLAMELKVPIILLSQLNRVSEINASKEPTMSELRESGDIEQDASVIILMWNVSENNKNYKGIKVEKNRMGELLKEGLKFNGDHMEFDERQEDFNHFINMVRDMDKGVDYSTDTTFNPFD